MQNNANKKAFPRYGKCKQTIHINASFLRTSRSSMIEGLGFFSHRTKYFWNEWQTFSHFSRNVWKYRLMNTVTVSFDITARQMTEMSLQKWLKCLGEKKSQLRALWRTPINKIPSLWHAQSNLPKNSLKNVEQKLICADYPTHLNPYKTLCF